MSTMMLYATRAAVRRTIVAAFALAAASLVGVRGASADDQMYFAATDNIRNALIEKINAETVRIDMAVWHLTDRSITAAVLKRFNAGVDVRLIGDRGAIFEIDPLNKEEFYLLANEGVPIRLRVNPTWYPEISHWKTFIFVEQGIVAFGSANFTPFELAPFSLTNYKDETVLFSDDPLIVSAIKTKFDQMWNDTTPEPESLLANPPYLKNWEEACATEHTGNCADYDDRFPNPDEMDIDTARLEPDIDPLPSDLVWGQGPSFNNRLIQEINAETSLIQLVIYRLTVANITNALLNKWNGGSGVPMQLLIEPLEYENRKWPEFWLTHAYIDKLWAAGVPIKQRAHMGLTHMKTLVTSNYATNASSNYAAAWQRDINYFIPKAEKPAIYQAVKDRVTAMWNNPEAFEPFQPGKPDTPTLSAPAAGATGVSTTASLVWNRAPFATSYDVYLGSSSSNLQKVTNVPIPAQLVNSPPATYSWKPATPFQSGSTYFWRVVARTFATPVDPSIVAPSTIRSFTTAGSTAPPAAPSNPSPSDSATGVSTAPTLGWASDAPGTTFNVAFGTSSTPPTVASGLTSPSHQPGALASSTTYFWRVTAVSSGGTTPGPLWSFTTGGGGATPADIVIHAADVTTTAGTWTTANDATAAGGLKLTTPDNGAAALNAPLANPDNYFESTFNAVGGTRYRVWFRIHAIGDQKWNDSIFVQFSDSVTAGGTPIYRIGTPGGYMVNLWTCSDCQSFGWGWQRNAYWLADTGDVWFQNSGAHTMRVQIREDGVEIDQIVLSPVTYGTNPPGPVSNDMTIVPKATAPGPGAPNSPSPADDETGVSTTATLSWSASGATSYDVRFGTTTPPPQVVTGTTSAAYSPSMTNGTTYFWQIVAHDGEGSTAGPIWAFTTIDAPQPPGSPSAPSPANGAAGVSTTPTLTWSAAGATSYEVRFGIANPPPAVVANQAAASYSPTGLSASTTYFWQIVAKNGAGQTTGPVWSFTTQGASAPATEIVIYASDVPSAALHGSWAAASDPTSPDAIKLATSDNGVSHTNNPLAAPVTYFDVSFQPAAGTPYRLWLRLKALNDSKFNDAVWVQFSGARANGSPIYPLNSTSALLVNLATSSNATSLNGWGWENGAYWLSQPTTFTFPAGGTQTMRIQIREDGVQIDQIVLSPSTYLNSAPGGVTNDATIVPKPGSPAPPAAPTSPSPAANATGVSTTPTLTWSATGATSYDVRFGTVNPPPVVSAGQPAASYTPAALAQSTAYFWQVVARNGSGQTAGPVWSFTTAASPPPSGDIVIYAADVPAGALHGSWAQANDPTSPGGVKLATPDAGVAHTNNPLAAPVHYFDVTFTAAANTPYRIWLRLKALGDSKWNDAVWVQFSSALANGSPIYPMNSTSGLLVNLATDSAARSLNGWGWRNTAYWLAQPTTVTFAAAGPQTLRVQIREDGVELDQIVLSPTTYFSTAPGPVGGDDTIVPKP